MSWASLMSSLPGPTDLSLKCLLIRFEGCTCDMYSRSRSTSVARYSQAHGKHFFNESGMVGRVEARPFMKYMYTQTF